ncbi:hypothetical protein ACVWYG_000796 [Pedobacter sp. UYEF25]
MRNTLLTRAITLFLISFGSYVQAFCQVDTTITLDQNRTFSNPILYGEVFVGGSFGVLYGAELNYQVRQSLFTARITAITQIETEVVGFFIPVFYLKEQYYEPALLYGYRYIKSGHSLGVSAGLSYNNKLIYSPRYNVYSERSEYIGFPFEVNYKIFKKKKARYRIIYGIFPIGKPTAFSRSFG